MRRVCPKRGRRVFVGMSGGVDSSVAAWLLKKKGYDVTGVFLRCYNLDGCAERDAADARRVAERLNIPFYVLDLEREYKERVVEYMVDGYRRGLTPNPDVMCNKEIKFGLFLEKALALGADHVATGHYVRVKSSSGRVGLWQARDSGKDQSYFLWTLNQKQLKRCLFPIGDYLKSEVRAMARKAGLPTAEKKDSQGICFLGNISMVDFLKTRLPVRKGEVRDISGAFVGEHEGTHFYTIGQRHLNLENRQGQSANSRPVYVTAKDAKKNILTVADGPENPALFRKDIILENVNFMVPVRDSKSVIPVLARVRYRQLLAEAELIKSGKNWKLIFKKPQKFVAAGQSAVFYSEKRKLLGGGVIE